MLQTDKDLKEKRMFFVESVSEAMINVLLDNLLNENVLILEEMEKIRKENATVMDKARALIDIIIRKGRKASQMFITLICEKDNHLAEKMGLLSGKILNSTNVHGGPVCLTHIECLHWSC